jgi:hypothetical protein
MSLAQPTTENDQDKDTPNPALIEYEQAARVQTAVDTALHYAHYTGICHDEVTGDWAIWQDGRIVGWDARPTGAVSRLSACCAAQEAHTSTLTVAQARAILANPYQLTGVEQALLTLIEAVAR